MKKVIQLLTVFFTLSFFNLNAQIVDTISMGANYSQQTWYKFDTDKETKQPIANWDLGFSARSLRDASIWVNPQSILYKATAAKGDWATMVVDTLKLTAQIFNSDTSWSVGAFNVTGAGDATFDYGWGSYNQITKNVVGDSVYVMKTAAGVWKKIIIDKLSFDTSYFFRTANLDGTNEQSLEFKKKNFPNKLMGYFSLTTNQPIDREPFIKDWDVVFGRYIGKTFNPGTGLLEDYPLTGLLQNDGVKVAKVKGDTVSRNITNRNFVGLIGTIGADWKNFGFTGGWTVNDSTAYFVKTVDSKYFRIVFTRFGGASTGNIIFKREAVSSVSVKDVINGTATMAVYPNPATDGNINVVFDLDKYTQNVDFQLFSITGQSVYSQKLPNTEGLQQMVIPTLGLQSGVYFARLQFDGKAMTQKIVVR